MKEFVCIICPRGCRLKVDTIDGEVIVRGNYCKKGYSYALQEYTNPMRSVSVNIRVIGGEREVVSARTDGDVPLAMVLPLVRQVKRLTLTAPIKAGEKLSATVLGYKLVATTTVNAAIS